MPGTESQRAQDLLHEKFAGAGGASARVVFAAPSGERLTDPDNRAAVMASVSKAKKAEDVSFVIDPFSARALSADKRIGFADVIYPVPRTRSTTPRVTSWPPWPRLRSRRACRSSSTGSW